MHYGHNVLKAESTEHHQWVRTQACYLVITLTLTLTLCPNPYPNPSPSPNTRTLTS